MAEKRYEKWQNFMREFATFLYLVQLDIYLIQLDIYLVQLNIYSIQLNKESSRSFNTYLSTLKIKVDSLFILYRQS